jgi:hypothetical protein
MPPASDDLITSSSDILPSLPPSLPPSHSTTPTNHAARPPRRPRVFGGALDLSQAPGAGRQGNGGANRTIHLGQRGEDQRQRRGGKEGGEDGEG